MAPEKAPRTKTLTLSLRLDPKTRFVLEFVAKLNRQSITTVVEEAIRKAGEQTTVGDELDREGYQTWRDFWDVSQGVRTINMLAHGRIPSSYEDDALREFVQQHIEFFSASDRIGDPDRINVHVLWPDIEQYLEQWRETRQGQPFHVGNIMANALKKAGVEPPAWPRGKKAQATIESHDLDNDIPF